MNYPKLIVRCITFPIWGPFWIPIKLCENLGTLIVWLRSEESTWSEAKAEAKAISAVSWM